MNNERRKLIQLLNKPNWVYEEREWMLQYLEDHGDAAGELKELMKGRFESDALSEGHDDVETSTLLLEKIHKSIGKDQPLHQRSFYKFRKLHIAAAMIGVLFLSVYLVWNGKIKAERLVALSSDRENNVITWGNKAMLTLEDGRVINLDDLSNGEVIKQHGMMIRKTADGKIIYEIDPDSERESEQPVLNTIATPRGGEYQVTLPDGSMVWLNASSSLTYPIQFLGNSRTVTMSGEAYFEVAKDTSKPFIVQASQIEINVLGTHFNVSAYANEPLIKTTLLEGAVQLKNNQSSDDTKPVILRPGDQATVSMKDPTIDVSRVDVDDAMAWRNGYFVFYGEDIHSVMAEIGRRYDLDVEFEGNLENKKFEGTISRMDNLKTLLEALELTGIATFKLEGRTIIVKE